MTQSNSLSPPQQTAPAERDSAEDQAHEDVRCFCGSLLAKLVEGGVELKCRRCKRIIVVPLEGSAPKIQ